jgi:membrane-associated phospholipid phosphatase
MDFLHNMDWVLPFRSDIATIIFNAFTWLGYATFFLIALPLAYWLWDRAAATRLVVLIGITAVINGFLKDLWLDARPDIKYALDPRVEDSYGRPSGHAQVAFAMWMWIAYEIKKPWAWGVAIFVVAGVCLSRLYLGVHDVDDILTGLSLGIIGMALFIGLLSPTFAGLRNLPVLPHLVIMVTIGIILWFVWPNDRSPASIVGLLALLFGWFVGADMDRRLAPNEPQRPNWILRIVMGVVGVVVLFAIQIGLKKLTAALGVEGIVAAYASSAFLGFYMTGLAPMAFRAVKLVK